MEDLNKMKRMSSKVPKEGTKKKRERTEDVRRKDSQMKKVKLKLEAIEECK